MVSASSPSASEPTMRQGVGETASTFFLKPTAFERKKGGWSTVFNMYALNEGLSFRPT